MASLCRARARWPPRWLQPPLLLFVMLMTALLLLAPCQAQQNPTKSDISAWDSLYSTRFLRLESDGLVHAQGRGRRRPSGLSITQTDEDYSVMVHNPLQLAEDTVLDRHAIGFDPDPVQLRGAMACKPSVHYVTIVNLAQDRSVRIDEIVIDHEAITTPSFMRGSVLDPGENMTWSFLMLPMRAENLQTYARVATTAGEFRLLIQGQVKPNFFDVEGIDVAVPMGALYENEIVIANTQDEMVRVTEIFSMEDQLHLSPKRYDGDERFAREDAGEWSIPPGRAKSVTALQFRSNEPGLFVSRILIIGSNIQLIVPVHVNVLPQGIHLTPGEVDLGILASVDEPREFFVTIYNTNTEPIVIQQLHPVHSNVRMSAVIQDGMLIPAMTRIQRGFQIYIQGKQTGVMYAMLKLITNGTEANTDQRILRVTGYIMDGDLAYDLKDTVIGVSAPLTNMFDLEPVVGNATSQSRLLSRSEFHGRNATPAGTSVTHSLHVVNNYDRPLSLERVWIEPENAEVAIESFENVLAHEGERWPAIRLIVSPSLAAPVGPRSYAIMVATQLTIHHIPIHLHYGILSAVSSSGLGSHLTYGVESASQSRRCNAIDLVEQNASNATGSFNNKGHRVCRSPIFDLGNVSTFGEREEILNLSNLNPIPIDLKFITVPGNALFNLSMMSRLLPPQENDLNEMVGEFPVTEFPLDDQDQQPLVNGTITLPARYLTMIRIRFLAIKRKFSTFSAHVLTIETPSEIIHLYTRFRIVRGSVYPTVSTIMMPPITRGKTSFVELYYRNTFAQNVTVKAIAFTNKHLIRPARISHLVPAQDTISVMKLGILLELDKKCTQYEAFYEDCFLPHGLLNAPDGRLSWFNEPITAHDLAALDRRQEVWRDDDESGGSTHERSIVETNVFLHTNMMHTHPVSVKAWQVPARIFSADSPPRVEFKMTEIQLHRQMFVHVANPTEEPVLMELVRSKGIDPSLFYDCDPDKGEQDCINEWQAQVQTFIQCSQGGGTKCPEASSPPPPPLYFKANSVHRIPAHGFSDLGPIYYLPSTVHKIETTIFVRNDLTHLESIQILASSGKADMRIVVDFEEHDDVKVDAADPSMTYSHHVTFKVTDTQQPFQRQRSMLLHNTGTFNSPVTDIVLSKESQSFSFLLEDESDGQAHTTNSSTSPFILPPDVTMGIRILYSPSCLVSQEHGEIWIQSKGTSEALHLVGHITQDAAYACRKAHTTGLVLRISRCAWALSVFTAVGIILFSLFSAARELIRSGRYHSKPIENKSVQDPEHEPVPQVCGKLILNAVSSTSSDCANAVHQREQMLTKIELSCAITAFSVSTPAVSELLQRRHKGIPLSDRLEKSAVQASASTESVPGSSSQHDNQDPEPDSQQKKTDLLVNISTHKKNNKPEQTVRRPHQKTHDTSPLATSESTGSTKQSEDMANSPPTVDNQAPEHIEMAGKNDNEFELEESTVSSRGSNGTAASTGSEPSAVSTSSPARQHQTSSQADQLKPLSFDSRLSLDWPVNSNFKEPERPSSALDADSNSNFELRSLALDSVQLPSNNEDSDWYFDSIQSEIGRLVNFNTESSPKFALHHKELPRQPDSSGSSFAASGLHVLPPRLATSKPATLLAAPPGLRVNAPGPSSRPAAKKAPPGFTPADANPEESLAAFERLRSGSNPPLATSINQGSTAFASSFRPADGSAFQTRFSLFGPAFEAAATAAPTDRRGGALTPANVNNPIAKASAGRIGSGRPALRTPSPEKPSSGPDQRQ